MQGQRVVGDTVLSCHSKQNSTVIIFLLYFFLNKKKEEGGNQTELCVGLMKRPCPHRTKNRGAKNTYEYTSVCHSRGRFVEDTAAPVMNLNRDEETDSGALQFFFFLPDFE